MAKRPTWYRLVLEGIILAVLIVIKFLPEEKVPVPGIHEPHLSIILSFLVFLLSLRFLIRLLKWWYRRGNNMPADKDDNVIYGLSNLYILVVVLAVGFSFLALLGIDYKDLFTTLSIVAAALAITFKDFITEIISGFIISFSRQINNEDYVKIGEHKGKIIDINLAKTTLLNEDDDIILIPNNRVFGSEITNYTQREIKKISFEFEVNLDAIESVEQVEAELTETLKDYRKFIQKDSYNLKIVQIKKDFLQMKFQYVLHKVDRELERTIRRKVARRVVVITKRAKQTKPETQPLENQQPGPN